MNDNWYEPTWLDDSHYTQCPRHEDYVIPEHAADCDTFLDSDHTEYCSCGFPFNVTECECDELDLDYADAEPRFEQEYGDVEL